MRLSLEQRAVVGRQAVRARLGLAGLRPLSRVQAHLRITDDAAANASARFATRREAFGQLIRGRRGEVVGVLPTAIRCSDA